MKKIIKNVLYFVVLITFLIISGVFLESQIAFFYTAMRPLKDRYPAGIEPLKKVSPTLYADIEKFEEKIYKDNPDLAKLDGIYITPYMIEKSVDVKNGEIFINPQKRYFNAETVWYLKDGHWHESVVITEKITEQFPEQFVESIVAHELGHLKIEKPPDPFFLIKLLFKVYNVKNIEEEYLQKEMKADCFSAKYIKPRILAESLLLLEASEMQMNPKMRFNPKAHIENLLKNCGQSK